MEMATSTSSTISVNEESEDEESEDELEWEFDPVQGIALLPTFLCKSLIKSTPSVTRRD